jgi:hypothetical protein
MPKATVVKYPTYPKTVPTSLIPPYGEIGNPVIDILIAY